MSASFSVIDLDSGFWSRLPCDENQQWYDGSKRYFDADVLMELGRHGTSGLRCMNITTNMMAEGR